MSLFGRDINGIRGDDLADLRNTCQALQPAARENTVRANDQDFFDPLIDQHAAQLMNGATCSDLIIIYERTMMSMHLISDQGVDLYFRVRNAFFISGSNRQPKDV